MFWFVPQDPNLQSPGQRETLTRSGQSFRPGVKEERASSMVGTRQQGTWTKWESVEQFRITWDNILQADYYRVRFLIQAVYDTLPSPANLHTWGKSEAPSYALCSGTGSLKHILKGCLKALAEVRYCWWHDQVLKAVAESVTSAITTSKHHHPRSSSPLSGLERDAALSQNQLQASSLQLLTDN